MELNWDNIKIFLEKYYSGETSLDEENALKAFFINNEVPSDLQEDKELFCSMGEVHEPLNNHELKSMLNLAIKTGKPFNVRKSFRLQRIFTSISIAATMLLIMGIGWFITNKSKESLMADTYSDPYEAYYETQRLLLKISSNMNKAYVHMQPIAKLEMPSKALEPLNEISKQIEIINRFESLTITKELPLVRDILWRDEIEKNEKY
jgi:hypothetical protein